MELEARKDEYEQQITKRQQLEKYYADLNVDQLSAKIKYAPNQNQD